VVDAVDGSQLGAIDALEMVTLGQRRGIGLPGGGPKRYVVDIDHASATVTVGEEALLLCDSLVVHQLSWAHQPVAGEVLVQSSAHGATAPATASCVGDTVQLRWQQPQRRVSPGQSVVLYDPTDTYVLGGGIAG
jgi:tRNA-specific 2-thiouridylase